MRATNGGWCWFCYGAPGEQVEHILAGCVRCGRGPSHCACRLTLAEQVQQGTTSLNEWLCSEIGDRQLNTAAAALLKAKAQDPPTTQEPQVYEAFFTSGQEKVAIEDPWVPLPREDSRASSRSRSLQRGYGTLEDMGPLPRPKSSASLADEDGELVKVSLVNLQVNQPLQPDPVAVARSKRREVHFEEEKVAERTRDVLWHLLPDPTPPAQKKKVFRSRRSNSAEDVVSVNSEDSTVSSAGRGTLDPWQRV